MKCICWHCRFVCGLFIDVTKLQQTPTWIRSISCPNAVSAAAAYGSYIFVAFQSSSIIQIYNSDTFTETATLSLAGDKFTKVNPIDMVATTHGLYVCDYKNVVVHKAKYPGGAVTNWAVQNVSSISALSVTRQGCNILVTSPDKLNEYDPSGKFVRQISFKVYSIDHAVQTNDDHFVVSLVNSWMGNHRICNLTSAGKQWASYKGEGFEEASHVAVDRNGYCYVTDYRQRLVFLLNPMLELVCKFKPDKDGLNPPVKVFLDERKNRLFVVCRDKKRLSIFSI